MKKYILIICFLAITSFIPSIQAKDVNISATTSSLATKDSYVHSDNPTSNYGGQDWLIFGYYFTLYLTEAYIEFDISLRPSGWTKAEIEIDMYSISETTQLTVSLITESWDELTINWMNKSTHGQEITRLTVATEQVYTIDVTSFISGSSLSICINATSLPTGYVQATSREGDCSYGPGPNLTWTHPEPPSNGDENGDGDEDSLFATIPGYNVFLIPAILIGISFIIMKKKLK